MSTSTQPNRRFHLHGLLTTLLFLLCFAGASPAQQCDGSWRDTFAPGVFDGRVYALCWHGTPAQLYAAGSFNFAGGKPAKNIAVFDGTGWKQLGGGVAGRVRALASTGNRLFIGGRLDNINGSLAVWDGNSISAVPGGPTGEVNALHVRNGLVIVGGNFRAFESVTTENLAALRSTGEWIDYGPGTLGTVHAIETVGTELWVGSWRGQGSPVNRWTGAKWQSVGDDLRKLYGVSEVWSIHSSPGNGTFVTTPNSTIYRWTGATWQPDATLPGLEIYTLATRNSALYAGTSHGLYTRGVTWQSIGSINGSIHDLVVHGTKLYLGGMFTEAAGKAMSCVASLEVKIDDVMTLGSGSGAQLAIKCCASADLDRDGLGELYVGGDFLHVGDVRAPHVARWSGSHWTSLGQGLLPGSRVNTMTVHGGALYVGGRISGTPTVAAKNVMVWQGTGWAAAGALPEDCSALASVTIGTTDMLFAGDAKGGVHSWTGSSWQQFGTAAGGAVRALAAWNGLLVVGGNFNTMNTVANTTSIAAWDGAQWYSLGLGLKKTSEWGVVSLANYASRLVVGGGFTVPNLASDNLAAWDGFQWSALQGSVGGRVLATTVLDGDLYIGGILSGVPGTSTRGAARWDGRQWSTLGEGIRNAAGNSGVVAGLSAVDFDGPGIEGARLIAVGEDIQLAGNNYSLNIAGWEPLPKEWANLHGGISGFLNQIPRLSGTGSLQPKSSTVIALDRSAPNAAGVLLVAPSSSPVSWNGGTLHAFPPTFALPFVTDASGQFSITFPWPDLACAERLHFQELHVDAGARTGIALSNGLRAVSR